MNKEPKLKEKFTVKCADCEKSILDVITLKNTGNDITKLKVYCTCGGTSYLVPVQGKHKICPVEPLSLKHVINSENRQEVWVC